MNFFDLPFGRIFAEAFVGTFYFNWQLFKHVQAPRFTKSAMKDGRPFAELRKVWASEALGIVAICVYRSLWQYQMDSFSRQGTTSTVASFAVRCLLLRCPSWTTLLRQRAAPMWCPLWSQAFLRDLRSLRFEMRTFALRLSMWLINWSRCHAWCLLQVSAVCVRYLKAITAKVNKQNKGGMVENLVLKCSE